MLMAWFSLLEAPLKLWCIWMTKNEWPNHVKATAYMIFFSFAADVIHWEQAKSLEYNVVLIKYNGKGHWPADLIASGFRDKAIQRIARETRGGVQICILPVQPFVLCSRSRGWSKCTRIGGPCSVDFKYERTKGFGVRVRARLVPELLVVICGVEDSLESMLTNPRIPWETQQPWSTRNKGMEGWQTSVISNRNQWNGHVKQMVFAFVYICGHMKRWHSGYEKCFNCEAFQFRCQP